MILNRVDERHGLVTVTPEQSDDLWALRRVISKGDYVAGETSRVYKETAEYARPDKERIKVSVTIEVESVTLDATLSRLKVSGKIIDVSNELISKGSFHSLTVSEGHRVSIRKHGGFSPTQLKILKNANAPSDSYSIVALDRREAGIGVVKGTHLQILPALDSGITGKMYNDSRSKTASSAFFEKIADALVTVCSPGSKVFVLGPSTTKNSFANYLGQNRSKEEFSEVRAIEGSDVSGEDGVYTALRTPNLQEALGASRLAKVSKIIAEVMRRISLGDSRIALAFKDSLRAAKEGAVESILVSSKIFSSSQVDEDSLVELLNTVEEFRGETFLLDSSTDLGSQVNTLGGVVALLRFAPKN
ncbi:MAG: pelota family protein [Nitrososphaerales archaeon]